MNWAIINIDQSTGIVTMVDDNPTGNPAALAHHLNRDPEVKSRMGYKEDSYFQAIHLSFFEEYSEVYGNFYRTIENFDAIDVKFLYKFIDKLYHKHRGIPMP